MLFTIQIIMLQTKKKSKEQQMIYFRFFMEEKEPEHFLLLQRQKNAHKVIQYSIFTIFVLCIFLIVCFFWGENEKNIGTEKNKGGDTTIK